MALAIKSVGTGGSLPATYAAGDLLLGFTQNNSALDSQWTSIASYGTTWSYDTLRAAYCIATSSSMNVPFSSPGGTSRIYAISGAKASDPLAGSASGQGTAWSWSNPVVIPSVPMPTATGTTSGSAYYDGTARAYISASRFATGALDFTIEAWYNARLNSNNYILEVGDTNISLQGGNLVVNCTGSGVASTSAGGTTGVWHHVAVVRSGNTVTAYVNGVSRGTLSMGYNLSGTSCVVAGYSGGNYYQFNGHLSNVRTSYGIARYTSNFTPPTSPLVSDGYTTLLWGTSSSSVTDTSDYAATASFTQYGTAPMANGYSPFVVLNDAIRISFLAGYGGGGNAWNTSTNGIIAGGPLTRVVNDGYCVVTEGGVGPMRVLYAPGYTGGNLAWVTVSVNPAPTSGFFSMF